MTSNKIGGGRNDSVDILKFFAVILITNSHMATLYPAPFTQLATGGAIGDALFFFCSGFTISFSRGGSFFNWYKRRINRIFPTLFAIAGLSIIIFGADPTIKHTVISSGGWFVQCIFVFYAIFWFVKKYVMDKLWVAYLINGIIVIIWYLIFWDYDIFILYNGTYLRWPIYFFSMLLGASVALHERKSETKREYKLGNLLIVMALLLLFYYGYQLLAIKIPMLNYFQLILAPVLFAIVYCFYLICNTKVIAKIYDIRNIHHLVYWISAICLEVYLCQGWLFPIGRSLINYFPLNVILTFLLIFLTAYAVKVISNFLSQTFKTEDYDWHGMIKL